MYPLANLICISLSGFMLASSWNFLTWYHFGFVGKFAELGFARFVFFLTRVCERAGQQAFEYRSRGEIHDL